MVGYMSPGDCAALCRTTAMAAHIRLNGDYWKGIPLKYAKEKKITIRCTVTAAMMSLQRIIGA